jgi:hypothetical protein
MEELLLLPVKAKILKKTKAAEVMARRWLLF